ncbi:MAG: hypothetical protein JNM68_02500, partial [Dinghuibacter sp.]|nr:hypothetical protein [Dinghuibacter sp.]
MYHRSDASYIQSYAIKCGEYHLNKQEMTMADCLTEFIGARPLNFYFETVETAKGYRLRHIFIILERESECTVAARLANEEMIIKKFQGYFDEYGPSKTDKLKANIFPRVGGVYPETTVAYRQLEEIELGIAYERAD